MEDSWNFHADVLDFIARYCLDRLADKPWQEVLLINLLWEKNIVKWLADSTDKLKQTSLPLPSEIHKPTYTFFLFANLRVWFACLRAFF
jgi:hypothetical protein